ncbi:hypothetical protein EVAR_44876_1 [Eumeta japonica]|uniref:Uncharacterized protein n=1 Tax=Eumeta variegata TaxID=151549 RepID=A0A4C1Y9N4_EUMVA|nr:hypothetical protein EVAR_44876_1 [Eumeta japonica]
MDMVRSYHVKIWYLPTLLENRPIEPPLQDIILTTYDPGPPGPGLHPGSPVTKSGLRPDHVVGPLNVSTEQVNVPPPSGVAVVMLDTRSCKVIERFNVPQPISRANCVRVRADDVTNTGSYPGVVRQMGCDLADRRLNT